MAAPRKTGTLAEETDIFWTRVGRTPQCWEWQGGHITNGYGLMYFQGQRQLAHRISWQIHFGAIPVGRCICHACDNPSCVRPDHLFVGTHKDNMNDMHRKGRAGDHEWWKRPGRRHHKAKLDTVQAGEIRRLYSTTDATQRDLAAKFGVSQSAIYHILKNLSYA